LNPNGIYYFNKCEGYNPCKVEFWSIVGVADKDGGNIIMTVTPFDKNYKPMSDKKITGSYVDSTVSTIKIKVIINNKEIVLDFSDYKIINI